MVFTSSRSYFFRQEWIAHGINTFPLDLDPPMRPPAWSSIPS